MGEGDGPDRALSVDEDEDGDVDCCDDSLEVNRYISYRPKVGKSRCLQVIYLTILKKRS